MSIVVRIAEEKDLLPVQRLVAKAGLEEKGIEQHIHDFLVVEEQQKIVGTVGIEHLGVDGLLRSLVIQSESWNAKIGLEFLEVALQFAKQKGVETLYLLTKQSIQFFEYLGFHEVKEEEVPEKIRQSPHFHQYVPGVTKVMATTFE
ncbi:GNAT family N-acetyltransferase [Alkalihalobacillus sp. LMS39]|uniref:GNAT family N-acetyltransferase n=1 Tax=Alkalihalobacillus sp. LMS39 TaxID=2924032 RepID=UPI001FB1C73E|nr:GNAT family N-acetyltransferase [Alkalihalobacillus sp. LMS39]UOE93957.1 GNAT family N-acetyltransferase [Alkalihalobacillus sp. LMS39]